MNLATAFTGSVQKHATKTAMFWGDQGFTFTQLHDQARAVAQELEQRGHLRSGANP